MATIPADPILRYASDDAEPPGTPEQVVEFILRQALAKKGEKGATLNIASAVTSASIERTIEGAATLEIGLADPDWTLIAESGLFPEGITDPTTNKPRPLPAIDVELDGRPYRLVQIAVVNEQITMTFEDRFVSYLRQHKGPLSASRNSVTRAQFIEKLVKKVKAEGGLGFYSPDKDLKQRIARMTESEREDIRTGGVAKDEQVSKDLAGEQQRNINICMGVAADLKAGDGLATKAMLCAGFGESGFKVVPNAQGSDYGGVFQGKFKGSNPGYPLWDIGDTEGMCRCFFLGGRGYQSGGAIALAKAHPEYPAGKIAWMVEGSRSNFGSEGEATQHYHQYADRAEQIISAYGRNNLGDGNSAGDDGGTTTTSTPVFNEGDSLAEGSAKKLEELLPTVTTDAAVGRNSTNGLHRLQDRKNLPSVLIVQLGTNNGDVNVFRQDVKDVLAIKGVTKVYWVNISRPPLNGVTDTQLNTVLDDEAKANPKLTIIDWKKAVQDGKAELSGDNIHPLAPGYVYRAKMIADAVKDSVATTTSGGSSGGKVAVSFQFTVEPDEKYWDAIQRLTEEPRTRAFIDYARDPKTRKRLGIKNHYGAYLIYMPEMADQKREKDLFSAKPVATFDKREDADRIIHWEWEADNNKEPTAELVVHVICERWQYRPGTTVKVVNAGPMSGKYLIASIRRDLFEPFSEITLKTPLREKAEPAHETTDRADKSDGGSGTGQDSGGSTVSLDGTNVYRPIDGNVVYGRGWHESSKGVTGMTGTSGHIHWHSGVDAAVPTGTKCVAPVDGEITMATAQWSDGGMVHFKFTDDVGDIKKGTIIGWGHCTDIKVHVGQKVKAGALLALSGNPGGGPHVHFIVRDSEGSGDGSRDPVPTLKALQDGDGPKDTGSGGRKTDASGYTKGGGRPD